MLYLGTLVWRNVGGGAWVGEKVVLVRHGFVSPYEFETRAKMSTNRKVSKKINFEWFYSLVIIRKQ